MNEINPLDMSDVTTDENAGKIIEDKIMECVELMGAMGTKDINPRAFDHFRIYDPKSKRYWLDTETRKLIKIDESVTGSDGKPCPPMDCVLVAVATLDEAFKDAHDQIDKIDDL